MHTPVDCWQSCPEDVGLPRAKVKSKGVDSSIVESFSLHSTACVVWQMHKHGVELRVLDKLMMKKCTHLGFPQALTHRSCQPLWQPLTYVTNVSGSYTCVSAPNCSARVSRTCIQRYVWRLHYLCKQFLYVLQNKSNAPAVDANTASTAGLTLVYVCHKC